MAYEGRSPAPSDAPGLAESLWWVPPSAILQRYPQCQPPCHPPCVVRQVPSGESRPVPFDKQALQLCPVIRQASPGGTYPAGFARRHLFGVAARQTSSGFSSGASPSAAIRQSSSGRALATRHEAREPMRSSRHWEGRGRRPCHLNNIPAAHRARHTCHCLPPTTRVL